MKLSRLQIRRLIEQVIKESDDESRINMKDIGIAVAANPLVAIIAKAGRKANRNKKPFKYEDGMGRDFALLFAGATAFTVGSLQLGDMAMYQKYKNSINPSDFSGQSIVVDADSEEESDRVMKTLDAINVDYEISADGMNVVIKDGEQFYSIMLDKYTGPQNFNWNYLDGIYTGASGYMGHQKSTDDPYSDDLSLGSYDIPDQYYPGFEYEPSYSEVSYDEAGENKPDFMTNQQRKRQRRRIRAARKGNE